MRGEVWTIAGSGYASKPRPAIIVQSDKITNFDSTIACLITSDSSTSGPTRVKLTPSNENGLQRECFAMADKVVAIKRSSLGKKIGILSNDDISKVDDALRAAMGL